MQAGIIDVAPPNRRLLVDASGRLTPSVAEPVSFSRPAADLLFDSVARAFGGRSVAIVLSGMLCDGARGMAAITRAGGIAAAQDEASAREFGWPGVKPASIEFRRLAPLLSKTNRMVKRYIVWSPRVPTCMNWDNRDKAERFAEFWRTTALLGCMDWRVSPILDESTDTGAFPIAAPRALGRSIQTDAANDVLTTARDELVELLASKDAVIAELQRKLNDCTLSAVREAAAQSKRIADLEQQVAMLSRSRVRAR